MRLNIEITEEEHRTLKTLAAARGTSIKEYVMSRVFPKPNAETLEAFKQAESGEGMTFGCAEDAIEYIRKL